MGYSVKEVGRMTFGRWYKLWKHYKVHSDNKIKGITYEQLEKEADKVEDGWGL